jgi:pentapeptide MXKDX repeat protein
MNIYKTAAAALIFSATTAFAQGMAAPKDTMAAPKTDGMTAPKDSMAMSKPMTHHKPMKHDSMKHDSMKSDSMAAPTH